MIEVTKLNDTKLLINAELIETVEETQAVRSGNNSGICLESSLSSDHLSKLICKIYIGHFKNAARHLAPVCSNILAYAVKFAGVQG